MSFVLRIFLSPASLMNASRGTRLWLVFAKQDLRCAILGLLALAHRLSCCSFSLESSAGSERGVVEHLRVWSTRDSGFENNISS